MPTPQGYRENETLYGAPGKTSEIAPNIASAHAENTGKSLSEAEPETGNIMKKQQKRTGSRNREIPNREWRRLRKTEEEEHIRTYTQPKQHPRTEQKPTATAHPGNRKHPLRHTDQIRPSIQHIGTIGSNMHHRSTDQPRNNDGGGEEEPMVETMASNKRGRSKSPGQKKRENPKPTKERKSRAE